VLENGLVVGVLSRRLSRCLSRCGDRVARGRGDRSRGARSVPFRGRFELRSDAPRRIS